MLPTVTVDEFVGWKNQFARGHSSPDDEWLQERLDRWATSNLPTAALPPRLQGVWNAVLKQKVADRLSDWFLKEGIQAPGDLLEATPKSVASPLDRKTEELRAAVLDCVRKMTYRELSELRIPVAVLVRKTDQK